MNNEINTQLISHYSAKIVSNSKIKIKNHFDNYKDKRILIYGNYEHFKFFNQYVYDLSQLNIIAFKDSQIPLEDDSNNHGADVILIMVLSILYERVIFDDFNIRFKNVDIVVHKLLLDIALTCDYVIAYNDKITHERFFGELDIDAKKLWNNIVTLESSMTDEQISIIMNKEIDTYENLLEECLKILHYLTPNTITLGYGPRMKYFLEIGNKLDSFLVFYGRNDQLPKDSRYLFGNKYITFFSFLKFIIQTDEIEIPHESKQIFIEHNGMPTPLVRLKDSRPFVYNTIYLYGCTLRKGDLSIGYSNLDNFINYYSTHKKETQNISIILSGYMGVSELFPATLTDNGYVEAIVKEFKENQVTLRPHIYWRNHDAMIDYKTRLLQYENFIFDENDSYLEHLSATKVFISEGMGSTAYNYAMATLKPVIFYMPKEELYLQYFGHTYYAKYREIIGDVASTREELMSLVKLHLTDKIYYEKKMAQVQELRDKIFVNIGNSKEKYAFFLNNYITLNQNSLLKNYYRQIIESNAKEYIDDYFSQFSQKRIGVFGTGLEHDLFLDTMVDISQFNIVNYADFNEGLVGKKLNNVEIISRADFTNIDLILNIDKAYEEIAYEELKRLYPKINIYNLYNDIGLYIQLASFYYKTDVYNDNRKFENEMLWINIIKLERKMTLMQIEKIIHQKYSTYLELFFACVDAVYRNRNVKITNDISLFIDMKNDSYFGIYYIKNTKGVLGGN